MAFEDVEELRSPGFDNQEWCLVQNSDTSVDIYGELQNTAEKFKKLADRLQKTASKKDLTNEKAVQTIGCCEETRTKLMEYVAENLRLRQSLKDVSDINHRWQDYNYDRQKHVQHLLSTVSELRGTIDTMREFRKSSSASPKEREKNASVDQSPLELRWTADATKHQSRKCSSVLPQESERNESEDQSPSEVRRTVNTAQQQSRKSSISPEKRERNEANNLSPAEMRRKVDAAKQQSRKCPSVLPKETERNGLDDQSLLELRRKADVIKQQSTKSSSIPLLPKESEANELNNNQTTTPNDKLSDEVRELSRQLKDARNESKAVKRQLEKVVEENDTLKDLLKTYRSDWENENRKKLEALSQAQRVVHELCALKVNCQMQAEKLMKISTVSFNCSLCQETQNGQALNNLNINSQLEDNFRAKNKEKRRKVTRRAAAIIQSVDGVEVHLRERGSQGETDEVRANYSSLKTTSEKKLSDSTNPIVTFPDSDSDEQTSTEKPSIKLATTSQHLVCPVCSTSFLGEHGSQFLDHYTKCKLSPGKPVS